MEVRRIAFVVTTLDRGGAEAQVAEIAHHLADRGWQVTVVSLQRPRAHSESLLTDGIDVVDLGLTRGAPDPRAITTLARITARTDVVHAHMFHAVLMARIARIGSRATPLVSTFHNVVDGGVGRSVAYRITDRLSSVNTAVSAAVVDAVVDRRATRAERIERIPNGVSIPASSPTTRADAVPFRWISVGSLTRQKNHEGLIRAFAVASESTPMRLSIVGEGPMDAAIRHEISELSLDDRVEMLGPRDDVPERLDRSDGFVLASDWEGLPMVLLEAGAHRLPSVATDVGGSSEIVVDGTTGRLVRAGDIDALAAAMVAVAEDVPRAIEMGQNARTHVSRNFDIDHIVDRWEALYRSLIDGP